MFEGKLVSGEKKFLVFFKKFCVKREGGIPPSNGKKDSIWGGS